MTERRLILDTETTGFSPTSGHRICSIAVIELVDRAPSGAFLHFYLDPERDSDPGALNAHGLTREFLTGKPKFASVWPILAKFIGDDQLIIHNAKFDLTFLRAELERAGSVSVPGTSVLLFPDSRALCTYQRAEALFGRGKGRNTLDALAARYEIEDLRVQVGCHGALIDCLMLVNIYRRLAGLPSVTIDYSPYLSYLNAQGQPTPRSKAADPQPQDSVAASPATDSGSGRGRAELVAS